MPVLYNTSMINVCDSIRITCWQYNHALCGSHCKTHERSINARYDPTLEFRLRFETMIGSNTGSDTCVEHPGGPHISLKHMVSTISWKHMRCDVDDRIDVPPAMRCKSL